MASLTDLLSSIQNGVIAVNNLSKFLAQAVSGTNLRIAVTNSATAYTPVVTSGTGAISAYTATGRYFRTGQLVFVEIVINITANGTGAQNVQATLPFNVGGTNSIFAGRENLVAGKMLQGQCSGTSCFIVNYDDTYPGSSGAQLLLSGVYEAA